MSYNIDFLTSNEKKAKDFVDFGLGVKEFTTEIDEVLSPNVETVVLYKARDTGMNNIVVEDTALFVDGADFWGTQIKHVYDEIKENAAFHGHKAIWEVSLCMKKDDNFYISTGRLEGILKYPALDFGYHFDRIFAIETPQGYCHFELLTPEKKIEVGPRFQALRQLTKAIDSNDFSHLTTIPVTQVQEWVGDYQLEKPVKKYKI